MNNRKLRSSVIRSRFGVQGVRQDRELRRQMAASTRRWRYLTAVHAALLGKTGIKAWYRRRKVAVAIWRNARNHAQLALRVAALVDPRYDAVLRKALQPGLVKRVWKVVQAKRTLRRMKNVKRLEVGA